MKKFATVLNGIDLSRRSVGDLFNCPDRVGRMLVLEGWAEVVELDNEEVSPTIWQITDGEDS